MFKITGCTVSALSTESHMAVTLVSSLINLFLCILEIHGGLGSESQI